MKKSLFAAVAAAALTVASSAWAVTVQTLTVNTGFGAGATSFTLAEDTTYSFSTDVGGCSIVLFSGFSGPVAAGAETLTADLVAGDYIAFILNPSYAGTTVEFTIETEDSAPAVPLPASAPLLALGLGGLGYAARRKAKAA